ncbi:alpha/beta hydrolase [Adonisia turfae]|nr:hypothetical protein [Adonisia turfae]
MKKDVNFFLKVLIIPLIMAASAIIGLKSTNAQQETNDAVTTSTEPTSDESTCVLRSNNIEVKLPISYSEDHTYPALIILPFTGGTPASYFRGSFAEKFETRVENPFVVILFDIQGSANDYTPPENFGPAIERCEQLVLAQLEDLVPQYRIDESRIALAGSSLGGDFSWSLSLRNADFFKGAVVINSRSGDRVCVSGMRQLAENNARFFLASSEEDPKSRLPSMRQSVEELTQYNIAHRFEVIPTHETDPERGYGPSELRTEILMQGVDFVLFGD